MIALVKQPAGIGDVFYLQKFAALLKERGCNRIIWPLRDDIFWISDYVKSVEFCKLSEPFPGKEDIYYSGEFLGGTPGFVFLSPDGFQVPGFRIMESKYRLINASDDRWYDYFDFDRNFYAEWDLFHNVLGLKDNDEYVLVNRYSNTDIKHNDVLDKLEFDLPVVEMRVIDGFTLFDWCTVLEKATEIHTVHTSVNYVIEKLDIKASVYNMYQGSHSTDVQFIPFAKNPTFIRNEDI